MNSVNSPRVMFSDAVNSRYQNDLVMDAFSVAVIVILPLILLIAVTILCTMNNTFSRIRNYADAWLPLFLILELYVLAIVMRMMYVRLRDHSKRDETWRAALIAYAASRGADTKRMIVIHDRIIDREKFRKVIPLNIMLGMFYCFLAFTIFVLIPEITINGTDTNSVVADFLVNAIMRPVMGLKTTEDYMFASIIICAVMFLTIAIVSSWGILGFPAKHSRNQEAFTREMSVALAKKGIKVPPMVSLLRHRPFIVHLLLTVLTAGLYIIYIIIWAFRGMNNHIYNQWMYEGEMLSFITHNGHGFDSSSTNAVPYAQINGRELTRSEYRRTVRTVRRAARRENNRPRLLMIAELFVLFICSTYILHTVAMECEVIHNFEDYSLALANIPHIGIKAWISIVTVLVDLFLLNSAVKSLLSVASRRPSSWRKVIRNCVTFPVPLWLPSLSLEVNSLGTMFQFEPLIITGILYNVLLIMVLSESVREFYTPVKKNMPRMGTWIRYLFGGRLEEPS